MAGDSSYRLSSAMSFPLNSTSSFISGKWGISIPTIKYIAPCGVMQFNPWILLIRVMQKDACCSSLVSVWEKNCAGVLSNNDARQSCTCVLAPKITVERRNRASLIWESWFWRSWTITCGMWGVTCDVWLVTCDVWRVIEPYPSQSPTRY